MGLASKFKSSTIQTPQSSQPPLISLDDYPPPQQDTGRYCAPPALPQQAAQPSAPPEPHPYYGYPASSQPSQVETSYTPSASYLYEVQGQTHPNAGQGQYGTLPYGDQQLQHGSTHPSYLQGGIDSFSDHVVAKKLQSIIQANRLQFFYDQAKFQAVLRKVASVNFAEIAAEWKISKELAYDLAPLALYDIVLYCDDSGSMAFEENGERINDLKFILSKLSPIATLFDDDGIVVRFMNSNVNGDGIRNPADVENLISRVRFSGMTPLGTNFKRKVLQPFVLDRAMSHSMEKPVLAVIITDGEPSGEDRGMIRQVISSAKDALTHTRYGGSALAIQIAQVGKDAMTQRFLESLDKDPTVGQMIDCTSYYELEEAEFARRGVTLTPELWLLKMCIGAIDPEYDAMDD